MNLYNILNINKNATKNDIKKAYRKLALKLHPDKNKNNNNYNINDFHNIQIAHDTLIDENKRTVYDSMSYSEQMELYNLFNEYFNSVSPKYKFLYKNIVSSIYNDEKDFKNDINNFNISNIYDKIKNKLTSEYQNIFSNFELKHNYKKTLNININATILEKYKNMFKKINYKNDIFTIPLRESECIIPINEKLQLHININTINNSNFNIINEIDLTITKFITMDEYINGGNISFKHIDNTNININFNSYIGKNPIYKIPNKGLPFILSNQNSEFIKCNNLSNNLYRGDLFIKFDVKNK